MALIIFCLCSCSSQYLVHFWVLCYEDLMWNCIKALLSPCHTHHLDMMDTRILSRPRPGRIISRSSLRIDSPFGLFRGRFLLSSATISNGFGFPTFRSRPIEGFTPAKWWNAAHSIPSSHERQFWDRLLPSLCIFPAFFPS
jgi:hypothetical protein